MDTTTAGVTVIKDVPPTEFAVAVIVVEPIADDVASPHIFWALLIEATLPADDVHVAEAVRF